MPDTWVQVKSVAFDGLFLEIVECDSDGHLLTILKFMKNFWLSVLKMKRVDKVKYIFHSNVVVPSPHNIAHALERSKAKKQ